MWISTWRGTKTINLSGPVRLPNKFDTNIIFKKTKQNLLVFRALGVSEWQVRDGELICGMFPCRKQKFQTKLLDIGFHCSPYPSARILLTSLVDSLCPWVGLSPCAGGPLETSTASSAVPWILASGCRTVWHLVLNVPSQLSGDIYHHRTKRVTEAGSPAKAQSAQSLETARGFTLHCVVYDDDVLIWTCLNLCDNFSNTDI